jgi:trimeric autotransporter adhesin
MLDARRRPRGRFFYCLLSILLVWAVAHTPVLAGTAPVTTQVDDVVFRADGAPASGAILISWPAFTTSSGAPVAAGSKSALLGTGGTLVVDLVPNGSANPAGTYYTVVFQLDDVVRTEYWVVGTTSPTTIGAVRTTPGSGTAAQMVSRQYVDSAVAGRASDLSVVPLGGAETIAGTKLFSVSPTVPSPMASTDAVNKAYVDSAVASVGAGSFVSKSGDAMAGPLTLPGDVASANGVNVVLDAQFVADLKALIQAIEQYAKSAGIPKPAMKESTFRAGQEGSGS